MSGYPVSSLLPLSFVNRTVSKIIVDISSLYIIFHAFSAQQKEWREGGKGEEETTQKRVVSGQRIEKGITLAGRGRSLH